MIKTALSFESQGALLKGVLNPAAQMGLEARHGSLDVPPQRAVAEGTMLISGRPSAEAQADQLVSQVFLERCAMCAHQARRSAGRDQRLVKLPIVALPTDDVRCVARYHCCFHLRQLVVGGHHTRLPFKIAKLEGLHDGMRFQEEPQFRYLAEIT